MFNRKLTQEEKEKLRQIERFVKEKHINLEGHDYSHVLAVTQYAIDIANEIDEDVEPMILICGALLHDIGRTLTNDLHGLLGRSIAEELLESLEFKREQIKRITDVIVRHTVTSHIPPQRIEEKIVYDADALDQLGAMGLLRGFIGKKGSMVSVLERYMSKREKAYDKLFFPTSQRIGKDLDKEMKDLIALFTKRLNERKHDVEKITLP
jgi:putative nucleotidyltransferase with HDIG domain